MHTVEPILKVTPEFRPPGHTVSAVLEKFHCRLVWLARPLLHGSIQVTEGSVQIADNKPLFHSDGTKKALEGHKDAHLNEYPVLNAPE